MKFSPTYHSYASTNAFSSLVLDYLSSNEKLSEYYAHETSINGIKNSIEVRKNHLTNRKLLVEQLQNSYEKVVCSEKVKQHIQLLEKENTFTVCTAHQPNIFTGHLYFVYKIIHTIKLSDSLNQSIPENKFVPVYYMGSEDADLNELGEVNIKGKKYKWNTNQKGAVGRMKIDDEFIMLLNEIAGNLSLDPFGNEIRNLINASYKKGQTIEEGTFSLVNELFGKYGLLIFLPDNKAYKNEFVDVVSDELFNLFSNKILQQTIAHFPKEYKIQTSGREINLFYLKDDTRERIEKKGDEFYVVNTDIHFTESEMKNELHNHPERFSPNVILRPLFQEKLLPNIAFIGGGGELAYWLELKNIFEKAAIPYPVLFLRNSFLIFAEQIQSILNEFYFSPIALFQNDAILIEQLIEKLSTNQLKLNKEKAELKNIYQQMQAIAASVDNTLQKHVEALQTRALKRIEQLEKKIIRAEKRKFNREIQQLLNAKNELFPHHALQERVDNIFSLYAMYGKTIIDELYYHSRTTEQEFCLLEIKN